MERRNEWRDRKYLLSPPGNTKARALKKSLYIPTEITKICNKIKGKEKQPINPHDFQHSSRECDVDRKK